MSAIQRNNVRVSGGGTRTLLFAHGFGCDQSMWRLVAPSFENDFRVVLFDHVGSGKSDLRAWNRAKYAHLSGYADDVLDICHELSLRDVVYVGHSVSAMIGVLAAIREPELFAQLMLIGPSPCYVNQGQYRGGFERKDLEELLEFMDSNFLGWSGAITPQIMGNADRPELAEELRNRFCSTDPAIAKHFARVTFLSDNRADLARLSVPTVVMQCAEDIIAPREVGEYVHRHLAGSRFVQMQATGHCPNLSAPQETIDVIRRHL